MLALTLSPALTEMLLPLLLPLWVSIKLATVTTICLLLFATPLAYWLAKPSRRHAVARLKVVIMGLIAMPLVLPPTVIGFYLLLLMSPTSGVGAWLGAHHINTLSNLAFTFEGLVIGSVIYSLPFYIQPVYAQFLRIPKNVMEMAEMLGANKRRQFLQVALPQAKAGIVLGSLISFAHTIGEFGVVLMIGGSIEGETKVISIAIYEQVEALNFAQAHTMSVALILLGVVMVGLIASVNKYVERS